MKKYEDLLTSRELEILKLVGSGHTIKEVAEIFVISANTVATHLNNIYSKIYLRKNNIQYLTLWYLKYVKGLDICFKEE